MESDIAFVLEHWNSVQKETQTLLRTLGIFPGCEKGGLEEKK